jgi:alpha/beta superfamily hydrolase
VSDLALPPILRVDVPSPAGPLEGLFRHAPDARGAAVVCHPHPVYGGDMRNRVVVTAARGLVRGGLSTLRFNFRGTGRSAGNHDRGVGERDDVAAAIRFLHEHVPEGPLLVAGYSFGCAVGLAAGAKEARTAGLLGIGVSFRLLEPPDLGGFSGPRVFVQGDRDELGPLDEVRAWTRTLAGDVQLVEVSGADHFFGGDHVEPVGEAAEALARRLTDD